MLEILIKFLPWIFILVFIFVPVIYLLSLIKRLVNAVEKIAEKQ